MMEAQKWFLMCSCRWRARKPLMQFGGTTPECNVPCCGRDVLLGCKPARWLVPFPTMSAGLLQYTTSLCKSGLTEVQIHFREEESLYQRQDIRVQYLI